MSAPDYTVEIDDHPQFVVDNGIASLAPLVFRLADVRAFWTVPAGIVLVLADGVRVRIDFAAKLNHEARAARLSASMTVNAVEKFKRAAAEYDASMLLRTEFGTMIARRLAEALKQP